MWARRESLLPAGGAGGAPGGAGGPNQATRRPWKNLLSQTYGMKQWMRLENRSKGNCSISKFVQLCSRRTHFYCKVTLTQGLLTQNQTSIKITSLLHGVSFYIHSIASSGLKPYSERKAHTKQEGNGNKDSFWEVRGGPELSSDCQQTLRETGSKNRSASEMNVTEQNVLPDY